MGQVVVGVELCFANKDHCSLSLITYWHTFWVHATYQRVKQYFTWKGLKQQVESFVQQCEICQKAKHVNHHPAGKLQTLPIPTGAWQELSVDFIEGLPKSKGYSVIMVVVDRLTKYAHFIPIKHPYTAQVVARLFLDTVLKLHGFPRTIVSDTQNIFEWLMEGIV